MIKVLFFAQIRELIGVDRIEYNEQTSITVNELLAILGKKSDKWHLALQENSVLCAVNQSLVESDYLIQAGDEVALFPPVTGG